MNIAPGCFGDNTADMPRRAPVVMSAVPASRSESLAAHPVSPPSHRPVFLLIAATIVLAIVIIPRMGRTTRKAASSTPIPVPAATVVPVIAPVSPLQSPAVVVRSVSGEEDDERYAKGQQSQVDKVAAAAPTATVPSIVIETHNVGEEVQSQQSTADTVRPMEPTATASSDVAERHDVGDVQAQQAVDSVTPIDTPDAAPRSVIEVCSTEEGSDVRQPSVDQKSIPIIIDTPTPPQAEASLDPETVTLTAGEIITPSVSDRKPQVEEAQTSGRRPLLLPHPWEHRKQRQP